MFKKLRNHLILINLGITTIVILIVFSAIYIFATNAASQRPPVSGERVEFFSDDFTNMINLSIENEKQAAARDLLTVLICSGVMIEIVVAVISYFLAEEAIKPVREAYESQKIFIANASHEIKTPLAAISANLEAANISGNKWINNVEKETNKLTILNNELLALARADIAQENTVNEVNLAELARDSLKLFEPRLNNIQLTTKFSVKERVKIAETDFLQILTILMDNAIKYCDKKITVELNDHELKIANDGVGIKKEDLPHIFERFYQTDKSSEGVGLGLAIAKATADRNNWNLRAESSSKRTSFYLEF